MNWYEVKIQTTSEAKDQLIEALERVGIEGVIILDPSDEIYKETGFLNRVGDRCGFFALFCVSNFYSP